MKEADFTGKILQVRTVDCRVAKKAEHGRQQIFLNMFPKGKAHGTIQRPDKQVVCKCLFPDR